MKKIFLLVVTAICLQACLRYNFEESAKVFSVNYTEKSIECDSSNGTGFQEDTILVTSNRNWSAVLAEGTEWIKLDTTGAQVLANVSTVDALPFVVLDNNTAASRSGKIVIYSEGASLSVILKQKAWKPRLVLTSSTAGFDQVSANGAELELSINCNTSWKVKTDPSDEASISFSETEGKNSTVIIATVAPNKDTAAEKTATISISAEGCNTIDIPVCQKRRAQI